MYLSRWEKAGFMHHMTGMKARIDSFYACFFCAAGYAAFSHNDKKEEQQCRKYLIKEEQFK